LGEISRLGNERKASVTHTKDFFWEKKIAQSDFEDKNSEIKRFRQ
jgi:hypothetical protein